MEESGDKTLKRTADSQDPDEGGGEQGSEGVVQSAKRPALSNFSFRPSPLYKATQGLILRQSSLTPPSTTAPVDKTSPSRPSQVGFLKLDNSELKPVNVSTVSATATNGKETSNHTDTKCGSFGSFLQSASAVPTFSSLSNTTGSMFGKEEGATGREDEDGKVEEGETSAGKDSGEECKAGTSVAVLLPEVQRVTGEEGEKKIVQINARLYAFDISTHSWKERGRGDIRLNDACQREGVFQSRLVMRASGSLRVLFNTHLWAEMKCERANQKTIRITAQDRDSITVFLITGNTKDIQQLFSAVDHRIEALRLNAQHSSDKSDQENEAQSRVSRGSSPSDEEDKESVHEDIPSSPESTVETHTANIRQKAVSLPSDNSGCEDGGEGEGEEEGPGEGAEEREESVGSSEQSGDSEQNSSVCEAK